jgi:hypothetical protein
MHVKKTLQCFWFDLEVIRFCILKNCVDHRYQKHLEILRSVSRVFSSINKAQIL